MLGVKVFLFAGQRKKPLIAKCAEKPAQSSQRNSNRELPRPLGDGIGWRGLCLSGFREVVEQDGFSYAGHRLIGVEPIEGTGGIHSVEGISEAAGAETDGEPSGDGAVGLGDDELGEMRAGGIGAGPDGDGGVGDVAGLEFAGEAVEVLAAVEIAACDQDMAGVAACEFVEEGEKVAAGAGGGNHLPGQQRDQYDARGDSPGGGYLPQIGTSGTRDDREQGKDDHHVADAGVVTHGHGDQKNRERCQGGGEGTPAALRGDFIQRGRAHAGENEKRQGRFHGHAEQKEIPPSSVFDVAEQISRGPFMVQDPGDGDSFHEGGSGEQGIARDQPASGAGQRCGEVLKRGH